LLGFTRLTRHDRAHNARRFRRAVYSGRRRAGGLLQPRASLGAPIPHGRWNLSPKKNGSPQGIPSMSRCASNSKRAGTSMGKSWRLRRASPRDMGFARRIKAGPIEWPATPASGNDHDRGLRLRGRGHINHSNARGHNPVVAKPGSGLCEHQGSRLPRNVHSGQSASFAHATGKIAAASREFAKYSFLYRSTQSLATNCSGELEFSISPNERLVCAHSEPRPQNHRRNFLSFGRVAGINAAPQTLVPTATGFTLTLAEIRAVLNRSLGSRESLCFRVKQPCSIDVPVGKSTEGKRERLGVKCGNQIAAELDFAQYNF